MNDIAIDTGGLFFWFGDKPRLGKITVGNAEGGSHYTLLINEYNKVVNIHKTIEHSTGKKYEQLFEMSFYTIARFAVLFSKSQPMLLQKYWLSNTITVGKLKRHHTLLVPFTENQERAAEFIDNKRAKKVRFKKNIPIDAILDLIIYPEELRDSKNNFFWVYSTKKGRCRNQGLIFRRTNDRRSHRFYFISLKQFAAYHRANARLLLQALQQLQFKHKQEILAHLADQMNAA
jgi:hypothetical protein